MWDAVSVSADEETIYSQLITHSPASVQDLATWCDMRPQRTARAVHRLVAKGLVNRAAGRAATYLAAAPDVAVEALVQSQEEKLRAIRLRARALTQQYHHTQTPDPARLIEVITGQDNVLRASDQIQQIAKSEVLALSKPPFVMAVDEPNEVEYTKLTQSVRYRAVWDRSALAIPGVPEMIQADISRGEQTRIFDGVPIRLWIVDSQRAMLPLVRSQTVASAILVHPSELLNSLCSLFELIWDAATPVRSARATSRNAAAVAITAQQRRLLEMLANGLTDKSISNNLGWSPRTVQRHVHQLMNQLKAQTRFQAGMEAVKRGLL